MSDRDNEEQVLSIIDKLLSNFGGSKREVEYKTPSQLVKKFDAERMEILEPAYIAGDEVDGHGDAYEDPVEGPKQLVAAIKAGIENNSLQYSIGHLHKTKTFEITEAWVNEEEITLDNGVTIPANQPLVITKFHNEKAYNDRVEGKLSGLSMGALGSAKLIKDLLAELAVSKEPKRLLSNFIFTHKAAHFAYTLPEQGGAASLKNDPYMIIKSNKTLQEKLDEMIAEYGEEFTELDKAKFLAGLVDKTAPSTSAEVEAQDAGVDNETVNKGQDEMSVAEKQNPELDEALKVIKAMKIEKSLAKYGLADDVSEALSVSLAELSDTSAVIKALDAVVEAGEAKVAAVEAEKEELSESVADLEKSANETPLEVEMNKELGAADAQERSEPTPEDILKANLELAKKSLKVK